MLTWLIRQITILMIILILPISASVMLRGISTCICLIYSAFVQGSHSWNEVILYDDSTGLSYPLIAYSNIRDISVSPDGESLYFVQNRPNRLLRLNIYSGNVSTVQTGFIEYPLISSDGEYLAYLQGVNFNIDVEVDTGIRLRAIASSSDIEIADLNNSPIAWYPDNQHITINQWNTDIALNELLSINIETGEATILLRQENPVGWHQWSPDLQSLAYYSEDKVYIYHMNSDTLIALEGNNRRPVWSRDGQWLAYIEQTDLSGTASINIVTTQGQIIRRIPYHGNGFITRANWWHPR